MKNIIQKVTFIDKVLGVLLVFPSPMSLQVVEKKRSNDSLEKARDHLIESAGKITANMLGMVSKVGGQIYALLFLSRNPLSLDDIGETLKLSKGNISVNVRMLEGFGLVKKVWVKGTRKDYYEANRDYPRKFLRDFFDRVRNGIDDSLRLINRCNGLFEQASKDCRVDETEDAKFMLSQLQLLKLFYEAASRLFEDFYQGRDLNTDLLRRVILE